MGRVETPATASRRKQSRRNRWSRPMVRFYRYSFGFLVLIKQQRPFELSHKRRLPIVLPLQRRALPLVADAPTAERARRRVPQMIQVGRAEMKMAMSRGQVQRRKSD